ncbi:Hypothetical protein I5071_1740 [Sandaracinus amylolyticus]|nr:Hypothetical protein I5071_1740 [Sandaracinus amylolyticus]
MDRREQPLREVRGDVTVPAGAFLVIQSGVTVRFATSDLTGSGSARR